MKVGDKFLKQLSTRKIVLITKAQSYRDRRLSLRIYQTYPFIPQSIPKIDSSFWDQTQIFIKIKNKRILTLKRNQLFLFQNLLTWRKNFFKNWNIWKEKFLLILFQRIWLMISRKGVRKTWFERRAESWRKEAPWKVFFTKWRMRWWLWLRIEKRFSLSSQAHLFSLWVFFLPGSKKNWATNHYFLSWSEKPNY